MAELHISSVATMGKKDLAAFRPVKLEYGKIHVSGGYVTRPMPVKSKTIDTADGQAKTFVKLASTESWLVTATTGASIRNGTSFTRTTLLEDLRDNISQLCDGSLSPGDGPDDSDPMMELVEGSGASSDATAAGKHASKYAKSQRWRYRANAAKHCVSSFDVPYTCPEVDPIGTKKRTVTVYVHDRKQIWLSIDDIAWAVEYLYTQNRLKGIPVVADDDAGPGAPPRLMAILGEGGTADADDV